LTHPQNNGTLGLLEQSVDAVRPSNDNYVRDSPVWLSQDSGLASDSNPFGYRRHKLVIHSFFDDSGKESDLDNRIVCIAGYLAVDHIWNVFSEAWKHLLIHTGISWLHLKDFMQDRDEYASLNLKNDWARKNAILRDFMMIIKASQPIGFGVAVDADAWREIPKEITRRYGSAQEFCFMRIMKMVAKRMKIAAPRDVVAITFDCDREFTPSRFQRFIGVRDHDHDALQIFQSFTIAEPQVYLPLQGADLLAWQTRKELMRKLGGYDSRPEFEYMFKSLLNLEPQYASEMWTKPDIEEQIIKPYETRTDRV
jgi:hypothetical protein